LAHSCHGRLVVRPTKRNQSGIDLRTRTENPRVVGSIPTLGTTEPSNIVDSSTEFTIAA
jgi:hypothetical protein